MAFGDRKKKKYRDFAENIDGEIVYNGELYRYSGENAAPYSDFRKRAGVLAAAALISVVTAGTFAAPGTTDRFYIVLPLITSIILAVLMCCSLAGVMRRGEVIRQFDVDGKLNHLKGEAVLASFFSAATFIAYLVSLFTSGRGEYSMVSSIAFPVLMAISVYSDYVIFHLFRAIVWEKQKKD